MHSEWLDVIADQLPVQQPTRGVSFRRWFVFTHAGIYIRLNARWINEKAVYTLELCDIIIEESARGHRYFSGLLDGLSALAHERGEVLICENVINEQVRAALVRRGFKDYQGNGLTYFKEDTK